MATACKAMEASAGETNEAAPEGQKQVQWVDVIATAREPRETSKYHNTEDGWTIVKKRGCRSPVYLAKGWPVSHQARAQDLQKQEKTGAGGAVDSAAEQTRKVAEEVKRATNQR